MRRKTRKPRLEFPAEFAGHAVAVCVEVEMIPLLCGLLRKWEIAETWKTDEDWQKGYVWQAQLQEQLMANCLQNLIDEQQRLYRLLDTALNGTVYEVVDYDEVTNKPVIEPEIPDVPPQPDPMTLAIRPASARIISTLDGGNITTPPADNILLALRGDVEADPVRNIAEILLLIKNKLIEADPDDDSLLEEIRKLLT